MTGRNAPPRLAAVILAAGFSRRFGDDKLLADFGGRTLLAHSVETVRSVVAQAGIVDLVLVRPAGSMTAAVEGVSIVHAPEQTDGFAASLRAGIAAVAERSDAAFVFLADMPFAPPADLLLRMIAARRSARADAARPCWNGKPGHPVLLGRALFGKVAQLRGDSGARDLLASARCVAVECDSDCVVFDVDAPADMIAARQRLARA